jgi:hypothetical protein
MDEWDFINKWAKHIPEDVRGDFESDANSLWLQAWDGGAEHGFEEGVEAGYAEGLDT